MPLCESLKPHDPRAAALTAQTILSADDLATSVASALRESGYDVNLLASSGGDVAALAADYAARASSLAPGAAVVRAAEPTVVVSCAAPGRGGRSSHLAALVARTLPEDVVFLAGASDGVDGDSDSAGAVVDRASLAPFDVDRALAAFATGDVHAAAGTALVLGPTGVNLADVHVLARARREAPRS